MTTWTEGYVDGLDYPYASRPELNPLRAALAVLVAGFATPEIATACELGFGQGLSANLSAPHAPPARTPTG